MRCLLALLVALTPVHAFMSGRAPRRTSAVRSSPDDFDIDKLAASLENPDEAKKELPDMKDQTAVDKMLDDAISEDDPFGGVPRASLDDLFPQ